MRKVETPYLVELVGQSGQRSSSLYQRVLSDAFLVHLELVLPEIRTLALEVIFRFYNLPLISPRVQIRFSNNRQLVTVLLQTNY